MARRQQDPEELPPPEVDPDGGNENEEVDGIGPTDIGEVEPSGPELETFEAGPDTGGEVTGPGLVPLTGDAGTPAQGLETPAPQPPYSRPVRGGGRLDEIHPGGRYFVGGRWVDSEGRHHRDQETDHPDRTGSPVPRA